MRPSLMQYLIGALAANAPLMFLLFALTLIEPSTISANYDIMNAIILFSTFGGALLAGLLIEEKAGTRERIRLFPVGMIMGIFCYLLNYVLAMISFIPRTFSEFITVALFEAGAVLGVFLRALTSKQSTKKTAGAR